MRRSGAAHKLMVAVIAGMMLGSIILIAWSCQTTQRTVPIGRAATQSAEAPTVDVSAAAHSTIRDEPLVRVRIRRGVSESTLSTSGPWVVAASGARTGEVLSGPIRVLASNRGIKLIDSRNRVTGFPPSQAVFAAPQTATDGRGTVIVDTASYPGTLRLVPRDEPGTFDVVNVLDVEHYLPGVISRELYSHWNEGTFRVQAVAARTYALSRREDARRVGRHYDVESSTVDQVYGGRTGLDVAHRAVEATRGIVLIDQDRLATAYYSSTCGGRPALPDEVWPSAQARISPVSLREPERSPAAWRETLCDDAPLYAWDTVRSTEAFSKRVAAWGAKQRLTGAANLGTLRAITPIEFGESGRPIRYRLDGRNGQAAELTGEQLRLASNFSASGMPDLDQKSRVHSNDLEFNVGRRVTRIRGHGHGHGVGLCQFCAQAMAQRGDTYRDMLARFYPGLEIRRVY